MESHLLQMRGLKLSSSLSVPYPKVASFTDAWIETLICIQQDVDLSRIFYRCVD